jgi:hypothetical protein
VLGSYAVRWEGARGTTHHWHEDLQYHFAADDMCDHGDTCGRAVAHRAEGASVELQASAELALVARAAVDTAAYTVGETFCGCNECYQTWLQIDD